jgi:hypothetical protein
MSQLSSGWHHMVAVGDNNSTSYYIDGALVGSIPWASASNINTVGNRNNTAGSIGSFDEFAVYDYALSPARIMAHYQSSRQHNYCDYVLPPNRWHNLAAKIDSNNNQIEAFVNGESLCSVSITQGPGVIGTADDLLLGQSNQILNSTLKGQISELRLYDSTNTAILTSNFASKNSRYHPVVAIPLKGLKLWLVAGENIFQDVGGTTPATTTNQNVSLWKDLSGNGGDLTPVALSPVLKRSVLNGQDAIEFDGATGGSSQRLRNTINYGMPSSVFAVARIMGAPAGRVISGSSNNWLLGFYNGFRNSFHPAAWVYNGASSVVNESWELFMGDLDSGGFGRFFRNGSLVGSATSATFRGPNGITLGAYNDGSQPSRSQVAAVIVYDRILTSAERQKVEQYLESLYGNLTD